MSYCMSMKEAKNVGGYCKAGSKRDGKEAK